MPLYMIDDSVQHEFPYIAFFNTSSISPQVRSYLSANGFRGIQYTALHDVLVSSRIEKAYIHLPDFYDDCTMRWDSIKVRVYLSNYTLLSIRHVLALIENEQAAERQRRREAAHIDKRPLHNSGIHTTALRTADELEDEIAFLLDIKSIITSLTPRQRKLLSDILILDMTHEQIARNENTTRQAVTRRVGRVRDRLIKLIDLLGKE